MNVDNKERMGKLLSALTCSMDDEEIALSSLEALIASEIVIHRMKADLTQEELAKQLGVSQSTLSKWESGECNFRLSTIVSIAAKLGIALQSPFVPTPPTPYSIGNSNVYSIVPSSNYATGASCSDTEYRSSGSYEEEYKEM